jgi:SAM-dependent methyltransferase
MFDEKVLARLICPVTGQDLRFTEDSLIARDGTRRYLVDEGIARMFVVPNSGDEAGSELLKDTALTVQDFYQESPFPNYNDFDNLGDFVKRARRGVFARLLSEQIPMNADVLEVGCGTGQLSNYLAATCMARIFATDMTLNSLRLGRDFATRNNIRGISFIQMNLFYPAIAENSMDIVISNGVLHHTHDTRKAFESIARLVKPGGYILIGLYNKLGRLRTDLRRVLFRVFGEKALFLDPHLRNNLSAAKRIAWIRDQYMHPQERKHTMSEVLEWFDGSNFEYINSIPKIHGDFTGEEKLFDKKNFGTKIDRTLAELGMLFTFHGGEGGLFIMIGRKR